MLSAPIGFCCMKMEPEVGASRPLIILIRVVLPLPFGPSRPMMCPLSMARLIWSMAVFCRNIWSDLYTPTKCSLFFSFHRLIHERQDFIILKAELPHLC